MVAFAICAFDFEPTSFVNQAFCDFFEAIPDVCKCRIDDCIPVLHTFSDEFRKLMMLHTMMPRHFLRIFKIHDGCMMQAHRMMKPSQPKRGISGRR